MKEKNEKKLQKQWSRKKKRTILSGGAAVLVCGAVIAVKAAGGNAAMPVQTVTAYTGTVDAVFSTSGKVESENIRTYFAPAGAKITEVNGSTGEYVEAGTQMIIFDVEDLERRKAKADLQVRQASNSYKSAMLESGENQADYDEASVGLEELKAMKAEQEQYVQQLAYELEDDTTAGRRTKKEWILKLQEELAYQQSLASEKQARGEEVDESLEEVIRNIQDQISAAQSDLEFMSSEGELSKKQRLIDSEKKKLQELMEEVQRRESRQSASEAGILNEYARQERADSVESARLAAEDVQEELSAAAEGVKSDFSGIITEMHAVEGATVQEGMQLFTVADSENVKVVVEAGKYDLEKLQEGQKADVTIAGKVYEGVLSKISRIAANNATGNPVVKTEIHILNPDENIFLGLDAKVNIHMKRAENVVLVPYEAVNLDQEGDFCYVVRNGIVEKQRIVTGVSSDTEVEVVEGIAEGEAIIPSVSGMITEGMQVIPVTE